MSMPRIRCPEHGTDDLYCLKCDEAGLLSELKDIVKSFPYGGPLFEEDIERLTEMIREVDTDWRGGK